MKAQDDPCLTRTVVVTAIETQGNPVKNLQASDLAGKLHGQPVQVVSLELTRRRPRIMVVLDMSGSMVAPDDRVWPITRMMLEDVVRLDSEAGQMGLALFGTEVFKLVGLSSDLYAVHKEVAALLRASAENVSPMPERKTALWDALWQAADQLKPPVVGDVIYALTDGGDNHSKHTVEQLKERLLHRGTRVFAFIPTADILSRSRSPEDSSGPGILGDAVKVSGGSFISICPDRRSENCQGILPYFGNWISRENRSVLLDAAHRLYQQMAVFYEVKVQLRSPVEKMEKFEINAVDDRGHKRRDIDLLYPHRLPPCAGSSGNQSFATD